MFYSSIGMILPDDSGPYSFKSKIAFDIYIGIVSLSQSQVQIDFRSKGVKYDTVVSEQCPLPEVISDILT